VRQLGGQKDDYAPRTRESEVLLLCPFDDEYAENCWPELQRALRDTWGKGVDPGPARRVIDLQSPELVGNRLYGAIRRDAVCVADLTLNRPNVFFELGVRMVSNENGARAIRCGDLTEGDGGDAICRTDCVNLDALLGTRTYHVRSESSDKPVTDAIQTSADAWPGGTVTSGYAFAIAQDSVDLRQEAGGRRVESLLWSAMEETVGTDRKQSGTRPPLYAESNPAIQAQTRRFAFDAMVAYVLFTDSLPPARRDVNKRAFAIDELDDMMKDLELDEVERTHLSELLTKLKGGPS
jgi:hypothetical protein